MPNEEKEAAKKTVSHETKPEMVEVSKDKLDAILKHQEEQDKEIKILREASSRGRLEQAEDKHKEKELSRAYLKVFQGKVVIGWKSSVNKIVHNQTTGLPVGEVLQATYYFIDGTDSGVVDQVDFTRTEAREYVRILDNYDGKGEVCKIQFENTAIKAEPFDINRAYLNP